MGRGRDIGSVACGRSRKNKPRKPNEKQKTRRDSKLRNADASRKPKPLVVRLKRPRDSEREAEARQRALEEQHAQDLEARRQQAANKMRPTPQVRRWPLIAGMVGVVALVALIAVFDCAACPASLPKPTQTAASAQVSPTVSKPELPINTPQLTSTPTHVPSTVDPSPGIGSTQVSDKDGMTLLYVPAGEFIMGSNGRE